MNYSRFILFCTTCVLALLSPVFADKPLLAVLPVKLDGAEAKKLFTKEDISYMSDRIRGEGSRILGAQVTILSQSKIDKLEMANAQECNGAGCFAGFLKTISADYGLQPTVRVAGGELHLTLELASNEATIGMQEDAETVDIAGKNRMIKNSQGLVNGLFSQLTAELGGTSPVVPATIQQVAPPKVSKGMVAIPAGCFDMGSTDGGADEKPVHRVCLSAFSMDKTPVTNAQFRASQGSNSHESDGSCYAWDGSKLSQGNLASTFQGVDQPQVCVDWNQAKSYCESQGKRLPTEAEYEYANRAGSSSKWQCGNDESCLNKIAWYSANSNSQTHPVGQKQPNAWGLYDMTGNVWEWTGDWYADYTSSQQQDPQGGLSGSYRVYRGGGWSSTPVSLRSADRSGTTPSDRYDYLGFRCVSPRDH